MPFYVVRPKDECGPSIPWTGEEISETFDTKREAYIAAETISAENPGDDFYIVQAISVVRCEVSKPTIEDLK